MNAVDFVIILVLLYGLYRGYKSGGITSLISLVSMVFTFVLAYFVKNPLSQLMYENLPFVKFGGVFSNISSINILVYEAVAYVICFIIITFVIRIILHITGLVDHCFEKIKIAKFVSKLLGSVFGFLEYYIYLFIFLLLLSIAPVTAEYFNGSKAAEFILYKTPVVSPITSALNNTVKEVYDICVEYKGSDSRKEADYKALDTMMKYQIISARSVEKLGKSGKITVDNYQLLVDKYNNKVSNAIDDAINDKIGE